MQARRGSRLQGPPPARDTIRAGLGVPNEGAPTLGSRLRLHSEASRRRSAGLRRSSFRWPRTKRRPCSLRSEPQREPQRTMERRPPALRTPPRQPGTALRRAGTAAKIRSSPWCIGAYRSSGAWGSRNRVGGRACPVGPIILRILEDQSGLVPAFSRMTRRYFAVLLLAACSSRIRVEGGDGEETGDQTGGAPTSVVAGLPAEVERSQTIVRW